jgi:23S rRNA pseudouridine1911/1915/1917 synthase
MTEERLLDLTVGVPGLRLDQFVAVAVPDLSRTEAQRLIKAGRVWVNQRPAKSAYHVSIGDRVQIAVPAPPPRSVKPEVIPLHVLYEDADLVAVDKPAGMVVHPAHGNTSGTLVNAALSRWPEMRRVTGEERAGIVHRLDKDTSGVIVLAKTPSALKSLQEQFKARSVRKRYLALVDGIPASSTGIISAPIGRDPHQRKRMAVTRSGRPSETRYRLIEDLKSHALLSVEPLTGRTHQIRVHLAWLGYPVTGDTLYGHRRPTLNISRPFLHATELQVDSPSTGARLCFVAPLPPELEEVLSVLRHTYRGG